MRSDDDDQTDGEPEDSVKLLSIKDLGRVVGIDLESGAGGPAKLSPRDAWVRAVQALLCSANDNGRRGI